MKLHRTTVWHEILLLVLYFIFSAPVFVMFYPEEIHGDGGIVVMFPIIVAVLSIIILLTIVILTKILVKDNSLELWYGVFLLFVSSGISLFFLQAGNSYLPLVKSNTTLIIGLYSISVRYKWRKINRFM